jgi:hypothetical protein
VKPDRFAALDGNPRCAYLGIRSAQVFVRAHRRRWLWDSAIYRAERRWYNDVREPSTGSSTPTPECQRTTLQLTGRPSPTFNGSEKGGNVARG